MTFRKQAGAVPADSPEAGGTAGDHDVDRIGRVEPAESPCGRRGVVGEHGPALSAQDGSQPRLVLGHRGPAGSEHQVTDWDEVAPTNLGPDPRVRRPHFM